MFLTNKIRDNMIFYLAPLSKRWAPRIEASALGDEVLGASGAPCAFNNTDCMYSFKCLYTKWNISLNYSDLHIEIAF